VRAAELIYQGAAEVIPQGAAEVIRDGGRTTGQPGVLGAAKLTTAGAAKLTIAGAAKLTAQGAAELIRPSGCDGGAMARAPGQVGPRPSSNTRRPRCACGGSTWTGCRSWSGYTG
jgi:hypothetical protein